MPFWGPKRNQPHISLLVPFRTDGDHREMVWRWLTTYWRNEMPDVELIIGRDYGTPFSKSVAVNDAASRATGDIFVIIDADCYIRGDIIYESADRIRAARDDGNRLWLIPYRRIYRLTEFFSAVIMNSDPRQPVRVPDPPFDWMIESTEGTGHGHRYGALIQVMPREAFEEVGGMDPRFRGWGGEDVSFMRAVDTLWGRHKTLDHAVNHLWHPKLGDKWPTREWAGQDRPRVNDGLASRYNMATGDYARMRKLVDEGFPDKSGWQKFVDAILNR